MFKLCVLTVVVAVASCQQPAASPLVDHNTLTDPQWLGHLQRNRLYYRNRGLPGVWDETPKPYSFSYDAVDEDGYGSSSRREVADATGRVEGSYSLTNDEGHTRVVQYVADEAGFRANIKTNEPGTDNQNPADVVIESQAPSVFGGYPYYRPRQPIRSDRPVEVINDVVTEAPAQPPVPVRPLPYYQRIPTYDGRRQPSYPRYRRPYTRYN